MADPVISEIKYLGNGDQDFLEVRVPDDYPDPENLRLVIYDLAHNDSETASPAATDIYNITTVGKLADDDADGDGIDDDGILHYTIGFSEEGSIIRLHALDAVGLYNVATGETYGLYNWSGADYTVSEASGDPFAGQLATPLDPTGQIRDVTSLERQANGDYILSTAPDPGNSYICFADGTNILTVNGERAVEDLCIGDEVITKDRGAQRVCWIGHRKFADLGFCDHSIQPITIKAHAFGPNVPSRDTKLSPNHAVLNDHWKASIYFGDDEVLTSAKCLLVADYAFRDTADCVTYYHILLEQHSLVQANGMWSESLYLGSQCMEMLSPANRHEVLTLFPELGGDLAGYGRTVRPHIKYKDARLLM